MIFNEKTLRQLEQLTLVADNVRVGVMKGDRRSKKRGTSVEFADYRDYVRGDDLRRLDWNVYARLERPFIKLLEEEEDLAVHILVDGSASMNWPEDKEDGDTNKFVFARRLGAALAHIGLATGDLVTVNVLGSEARRWGPFRGQQNSLRLLQFLESTEASGLTDMNVALKEYALRGRRPGLCFVISDMFSPSGYQDGVAALAGRGYEVVVLHLLSRDEVEPPADGDLKLVDVETGAEEELTLDAGTVREYAERLQAWQEEMAGFVRGRRGEYVPVVTDEGWERLVMQTLRGRGVIH